MLGPAVTAIGYIGKDETIRHKNSGVLLEGPKADLLRNLLAGKRGRPRHQAAVFKALQASADMAKLSVSDQFALFTFVGTDPELGDPSRHKVPLVVTAEQVLQEYEGKVDADDFAFTMASLALAKAQSSLMQGAYSETPNKQLKACQQLLKPLSKTNKHVRALLLQVWALSGMGCFKNGQLDDAKNCFKKAVKQVHGCAISICAENQFRSALLLWRRNASPVDIAVFLVPRVKQWWASLSPDNYYDVLCYTYTVLQCAWGIRSLMCIRSASLFYAEDCEDHGFLCPVNPLPQDVAELLFQPLPEYVGGRLGYDWHFGLSRVGTTLDMRPRHHEWSVVSGVRGAVNDWLEHTTLMEG